MASGCLACELSSGERELVGGRIHVTEHWVLEHCVGPLGVGTLLAKPLRHCLHVGQLSDEEAREMGPLLRSAAACVQELAAAEQVYVCLWSHAAWEAVHIHFVIQPSWAHLESKHSAPGPTLQSEMFGAGVALPREGVEAFCTRARDWFAEQTPRP